MKPILFNDSRIDTKLFLQLQDLGAVLAKMEDLSFEYNYGTFIDLSARIVTASHYWDHTAKEVREAGLKTDIFLRTAGTYYHSDVRELNRYKELIDASSLPIFGGELFTVMEDMRLEDIVRKERPGTAALFRLRQANYRFYFNSQLQTNVTKGYPLDELFCMIYLVLHSDTPDPDFPRASARQLVLLESLKPILYGAYEARNTSDVAAVCMKILYMLEDDYQDVMNQYFIYPTANTEAFERSTLFDEMTRNAELDNEDSEEGQEEEEAFEESFSTWHRENKNEGTKQTFLQFELERGTKTDIMGKGAREAEEGDHAMAAVQGSSGKSTKKDYTKLETLKESPTNSGAAGQPYGEENKEAVKVEKKAADPTPEEEEAYRNIKKEIEPLKRKLKQTIQKTLDHQLHAKRNDLLYGRLSKKLIPAALRQTPRVFYKKDNPSKEIDGAFTLLIDCSASMHNKMEETKKGVALFHEVLYELRIPHSIIGFWEDANEAKEGYQPNHFHMITDFTESMLPAAGARIMQLTAEEDNRDGYSIRVAAEALRKRNEKNKFLLVFSDGEPAAYQYEANGIIDTYEAVQETRKKGIDVIGLFLAEGIVEEQDEKTMKNIYGKEYIMVPSVNDLSSIFAPLLKKLLLYSI